MLSTVGASMSQAQPTVTTTTAPSATVALVPANAVAPVVSATTPSKLAATKPSSSLLMQQQPDQIRSRRRLDREWALAQDENLAQKRSLEERRTNNVPPTPNNNNNQQLLMSKQATNKQEQTKHNSGKVRTNDIN